MNLKDIRPVRSKFNLKLLGEECYIEPITLKHELDFIEKFGDNWLNDILAENNIEKIMWIVYRLLSEESKAFFIKRDMVLYDDDGNEHTASIGGVKLFIRMISGPEESGAIIEALVDNIIKSRPEEGEGSSKKKVM